MSNVVQVEPRPQLMAGHRPQAIVPHDMDSAYRLAKAVCMAGMAPKGLDTPEKAMVAIMHGLEIGLTPMAALQRIAVVNGRPTLWGDGAMGLVRGSGLCEWVREEIEGEGDKMVAVCTAKRKGEPQPVARRFSVMDAKKANLWGKAGPWQQFPTRMLAMRARAFCLRDVFADVLGGMYLREELEDSQPAPVPPAPPAMIPTPPAPPPVIEAKPAPKPEVQEFVAKAQEAFPGAEVVPPLEAFAQAIADAADMDEVNAAWERIVDPAMENGTMTQNEFEEAAAIHRKREYELQP